MEKLEEFFKNRALFTTISNRVIESFSSKNNIYAPEEYSLDFLKETRGP